MESGKIIVFISYCVILIIIGFWSVRIKKTNVEDFFLLSSRISDIPGNKLESDNCKTSQGISNNYPATGKLLKGRLKYLHLK
jgi:hypothetical protein